MKSLSGETSYRFFKTLLLTFTLSYEEPTIHKVIGVTEFPQGFRTAFGGVVHKRVPCVLTRGSRPEAVLMPYDDFRRFKELKEKAVLDGIPYAA